MHTKFKVQYLATRDELDRHGVAPKVKRAWVTVSPRPVRKAVAERILRNFKTDYADAITRIVEAR